MKVQILFSPSELLLMVRSKSGGNNQLRLVVFIPIIYQGFMTTSQVVLFFDLPGFSEASNQ